jgi:hypothetical protein
MLYRVPQQGPQTTRTAPRPQEKHRFLDSISFAVASGNRPSVDLCNGHSEVGLRKRGISTQSGGIVVICGARFGGVVGPYIIE